MTVRFNIFASIFGTVSLVFYRYEYHCLSIIFVALTLSSLLIALFYSKTKRGSPEEEFKKEIEQYEHHKFPTKESVYALRPSAENANLSQYLCEDCASKQQKSPMHPAGFHKGEPFFLRCHECKLLIPVKTMNNALERKIRASMNTYL